MAFRYYQLDEKSKWEVIEDSPGAMEKLAKMGAKRASILAVSHVVDEDTDQGKLAYKGNFYADIDNKDLADSIQSAKEFLGKLRELGVPDSAIEIYASGSKGFHFMVHPSVLGVNRMVRYLPYIYKHMAIQLYVQGLDLQVYCGGKGNLFRLPNVRREDGRYRVAVHVSELANMTAQDYLTYTSGPRDVIGHTYRPVDYPISGLVQLFHTSKDEEQKFRHEKQKAPIPDAAVRPLAQATPDCITQLSEYKIRKGTNFNLASLQMAIFLARSGATGPTAMSLVDRMADHGDSTKYGSRGHRKSHVLGLWEYAKGNPGRQFSCAAMRSVVEKPHCDGCSLYDKLQAESELFEVVERPDGYYARTARDTERRLTNFVLTPSTVVFSMHDDATGTTRMREFVRMVIERNHEVISEAQIADDQWISRSQFLKAFSGIGDNLKVTASDNDIQNLKHYILKDLEKADQQERVEAIGTHRQVVNGKPRYTYVDPETSTNKFGLLKTHRFIPKIPVEDAAMPDLSKVKFRVPGNPSHEVAIKALIQANDPSVTGPLLGWIMACNLKAHIFGLTSQFPLLGLWGGMGSGKTQTAMLFAALHGCDFFTMPPPNLTAVTPFGFLTHIASSNSVVRIMDEYNTRGMGQKKYEQFAEYFKSLFNNSPVPRGTVGNKGATVEYFQPRSPVIAISEHQFQVPALRDRLFAVMTRRPFLSPRTHHFDTAKGHMKQLYEIGKVAVLKSLSIRDELVKEWLEETTAMVPKRFSERQQFCRAVILTGLKFSERVLVEEMQLNVKAEIDELFDQFRDFIDTEVLSTTGVGTTEVDGLMGRLGEMYTLTQLDQSPVKLTSLNVRAQGDYLLLDPFTVFPLLKLYLRHTGDRIPFTTQGEFVNLVKAETYFLSDEMHTDFIQSRPTLKLNLRMMVEKGIDVSAFTC